MSSTLTLYKLTGEYQRLMDLACDEDEDASVGFSQPFIETLEQLDGAIDTKLEGCCRVLKNMLGLQALLDDEAKQLKERSHRLTKAVEELKGYIQWNLEQIGAKKRAAGPFTLTICLNSQPSVTVMDLDAVPSKFDKPQERQVSLTAIRDAMKAGEQVPGVDLVLGSHLRVK